MVINDYWRLALFYPKDYERASTQFRSMLDLDPSVKPGVYEQLARVYEQQGDYAPALEQRRNVLVLSGAAQVAASLADAYAAGGA